MVSQENKSIPHSISLSEATRLSREQLGRLSKESKTALYNEVRRILTQFVNAEKGYGELTVELYRQAAIAKTIYCALRAEFTRLAEQNPQAAGSSIAEINPKRRDRIKAEQRKGRGR